MTHDARYVLLCRHGPHRNGTLTTSAAEHGDEYPTDAVARRMLEQLAPHGAVSVQRIWCATSAESAATLQRLHAAASSAAGWLAGRSDLPTGTDHVVQEPELTRPAPATGSWNLVDNLRKVTEQPPGTAILVVGHQPQLSQIADELLRTRPWRPSPPPTPVDRAALLCIELRRRDAPGRLVWAITYDDHSVGNEVREKIRLKMETAKLLGGALVLGLTAIFGVLLNGEQTDRLGAHALAVKASAVVLLTAAALYFATMFAYDSLLMPQRLWGESGRPGRRRLPTRGRSLVRRPPSSAAWVLYQNMMRVWRNLFTTASLLTGLGLTLLAFGALRLTPLPTLIGAALLVPLIGGWVWWSQPVLGSQD